MHAIKGGWSGQISALASDNELGGRKSRIRRSKEERKTMVESFIRKYQKSNGGNFPSLNLTHKEVGGSFYTVREIVRDIIQENRVLAPAKLLEGDSGSLEQVPLGYISMEPQMDLLGSDQIHFAPHGKFNEYQIASEDSSLEFIKSSTSEFDKEQVNHMSKMVEGEEVSKRASNGRASNHYQDMNTEDGSNCGEQSMQLKNHECENGKIVNVIEVLEDSPKHDKPHVIKDVGNSGLLSNEKFSTPGTQMLVDVQSQGEPNEITQQTREFSEGNSEESASLGIMDQDKNGNQYVKASQAPVYRGNPDFEVEKFPLRPFLGTNFEEDGGSKEFHGSGKTTQSNSIRHDPKTLIQDDSGNLNEKYVEGVLGSSSTMGLSPQDPPMKHSNDYDATILEHPKSLSNGIEVNTSAKQSVLESSTLVRGQSHDQGNINSSKGNNPNCETATKSSKPEGNPLIALLKGIASSFIKFWTE